ncbi:metal-dependent hydrolase [candidate division KSB1 bacterium]|nr:metal-dependent hydrolase [candidate division KSB1 bacterium]
MPTPVGHTLMGAILYNSSRKMGATILWYELILFVMIANFADLDYVPGYIAGNPNLYHHGMTHSFFFALLVSVVVALIYRLIRRKDFIRAMLLMFAVYVSHLVMDFLGKDTRYPFGEQLFWPLSDDYFLSSFYIFNDVHKASSSEIFIQSLFNWHNLMTIAQEVVILLPILILTEYIRKNRRRSL